MTKLFIAFSIVLLFNIKTSAQVISSAASGDWSATATWTGGVVPMATDSVAISATHTVTVTANANCGALVLNGGATPTILNINSGTTLTVTKGVTINRPTADGIANILNVGAGTLTAAALDFKTIVASPTRVARLSISTGTANFLGNTPLAIDGTVAAAGAASEIVFTGAGTLNLAKNFMSGANPGTLTAGTGTVAVNGSATMILGGYTYNNLTVAGSSGVQFIGNTIIGGTFNNTANNLAVRVRANLTANGAFNAGTGLYYFESTSPNTNPATSLTLTGNFTLDKMNVDTNLTLTIPAGTTLTNPTTCVNYGTLAVGGNFNKTGGLYRGDGTFSGKTYTNTATVVPGDTLSCMTFSNGYDNSTGTLSLDFSGATACTLFDQLNVTGTAKAGGILKVNFAPNYLPTVGQTFKILNGATTYTGVFDSILVTPRRINMTYANGVLTVASITTSTQSVFANNLFKVKTSLVSDNLTLISPETEVTNIAISNLAGQVLMQHKIQGEQTLNVANLPKGLYFVHAQTGQVGRFVKQ